MEAGGLSLARHRMSLGTAIPVWALGRSHEVTLRPQVEMPRATLARRIYRYRTDEELPPALLRLLVFTMLEWQGRIER